MPETTISKEITKLKFTGNTETVEENEQEVEKQIEYVLRDSRLDDASVSFVNTITSVHGVFTSTTDISGITDTTSAAALITGNKTGQHLEFDNNEIQSKTNATTVGTLALNVDGGQVTIAGKPISDASMAANKV